MDKRFDNQGKIAEEFFFTTPSNRIQCCSESNLILSSGMSLVLPEIARKNTTSCFSTVTLSLSSRSSIEYIPKTLAHSSNAKAATSYCCFHSIEIFNVTWDWTTFSIEDAVLQEALDHGITILQRRGDLIENSSCCLTIRSCRLQFLPNGNFSPSNIRSTQL